MRKYILPVIYLLSSFTVANAQLSVETTAVLFISGGAEIVSSGNVSCNANIQGTGTLLMNGTALQTFGMNGFSIAGLEIDNPQNIALSSAATISNSLLFTNGSLLTGDHDLNLSNTATISGYSASKFISTTGSGHVIKATGNTSDIFPVGTTDYTPVTILNTGTPDNFSVRVSSGVMADGTTGQALTQKAINRSWIISEEVPGGSNAVITLQWNASDELSGFNNATAYLSHYHAGAWDPGTAQAVNYNAGIAQMSRSGITAFSPFAVLNEIPSLLNTIVNLKLFLQGYYMAGAMQPVLYNQTGAGSSTVTDNISVELHDAASPSVVTATSNGMLNADGTVVLTYNFQPNPQYIVVKHRNSIETWSAFPVTMGSVVNYDFTTSASKAYGNNMFEVVPGIWAFYTGDLNQDGFIDGNDFPMFDQDNFNGSQFVYKATDMNGDGFVDGNDYPIYDSNNFTGVMSVHP